MRIQQIRYFLTLAEELHFWRSAEKLHTSQSTLSRQIQALEDELGFLLFERDKRNVQLTEAGLFLKENWSKLLLDLDQSRMQAQKIDEGVSGSISIAYPGSIAFRFLPELLRIMHREMPDLKIELTEPTDQEYEAMLLDFKVDVALSRDQLNHPKIASEKLESEPICLVVPENHWLTEENFKGLQDLRDEKFIISGLHHSTYFASLLRSLFLRHNMEPITVVESDFGSMIMALVSKEMGISILPISFRLSRHNNLRFIQLEEEVDLYVNWRKNDPNKVIGRILDYAREASAATNKHLE